MRIYSINVASTRQLATPDRSIKTGIIKTPVPGPVEVRKLGLDGDFIGNKILHGGEDQAVYMYSWEDYAWWTENIGQEILPGTFGENLTLTGFDSRECRIGDQFHIGDVILEISAPRTPCATLAARMGDSSFVKQFFRAQRPGAYGRVIREGRVAVGDDITLVAGPADYAKTIEVFIEWDKKVKSPEVLEKALNSPVASVHRGILQQWYEAMSPKR